LPAPQRLIPTLSVTVLLSGRPVRLRFLRGIKIMNQPQSAVGNCLDVQTFINAQPISRYQWRW
jgi:hypothetical protein